MEQIDMMLDSSIDDSNISNPDNDDTDSTSVDFKFHKLDGNNVINSEYHYYLRNAILKKDIKLVKKWSEVLIPAYESDSNKRNFKFVDNLTPLLVASQIGMPELVEYFLGIGNLPNYKVPDNYLTSLLAACSSCVPYNTDFNEHKENVRKCIALLIRAGACKTDKIGCSQNSALHLLAANDYSDICNLFFDQIDVDVKNDILCTPLMIAAAMGNFATVKFLKKSGADLTLKNKYGLSAAELAMINGFYEIANELNISGCYLKLFRAWSLVHNNNIKQYTDVILDQYNFSKRKQYYDGHQNLANILNMKHLEVVFHKHDITLNKLMLMSDSELKKIGVTKFSDRKLLLKLVQDVHKLSWSHDSSLVVPNFTTSVKPIDLIDFLSNIHQHLEFINSTIRYMNLHFMENSNYYKNLTKLKMNSFEKVLDQQEFIIFRSEKIKACLVKVQATFDKIYDKAFESDPSVSLNDEKESRLMVKFGNSSKVLMATAVIVVGAVITTGIRFMRNS